MSLVAGLALAETAVESANIVGYQSYDIDFEAEEYMVTIAPQFNNVGKDTGSWTITDTLPDGTAICDSDQVLIFDPMWYNLKICAWSESDKAWLITEADLETQTTSESITIEKGQVYYYMGANASQKIFGEVESAASKTITFDPDENYLFPLVNPYPVDTMLSDINSFCGDADQILVFDQAWYNLKIYAWSESDGAWLVTEADLETQSMITLSEAASVVLLPAGEGAFFMPAELRTWTVNSPLANN